MHTLNTDGLAHQPQRLLDDAGRGEAFCTGESVLQAVPLGAGLDPHEVRQELSAPLYDRQQTSLGFVSSIAGLSHSEMVDDWAGTARLKPGEVERELAAFGP